jgi:hypothetical protein
MDVFLVGSLENPGTQLFFKDVHVFH